MCDKAPAVRITLMCGKVGNVRSEVVGKSTHNRAHVMFNNMISRGNQQWIGEKH